jgi:hypothetical protein
VEVATPSRRPSWFGANSARTPLIKRTTESVIRAVSPIRDAVDKISPLFLVFVLDHALLWLPNSLQ